MRRNLYSLVLLLGVLLLVLPVAGCSSLTIGDIAANPAEYQGEEVSVKGTVGETVWLPVLTKGAYQVGDETGTIWVVTSQPPPQEGTLVSVKGMVDTAVKIGDKTYGTVVRESERK